MKKNKFLRLASILMIACLMTTCVISGTFAKYVTSDSASDKARVAYWGFQGETFEIDDLFKATYDDGKVKAAADAIAPGTAGFDTIQFKYKASSTGITAPEVAYSFKVDASQSTIADAIKENPSIQWAFVQGNGAPAQDSSEWGSWDDMINKINGKTENVEANKLPALAGEHTIAWRWAFEGNDTGDTEMSESLAEVEVKITITATQID